MQGPFGHTNSSQMACLRLRSDPAEPAASPLFVHTNSSQVAFMFVPPNRGKPHESPRHLKGNALCSGIRGSADPRNPDQSPFLGHSLGNSLVGSTPFLLEFVDPLLQGLHHAPQDHRELLVVEGQQLAVAHGLAERLAQFPGSQDVLGDEADLILGALHTIVDLGFQFVEELLHLFLRDLPDVLLELPIRRVHVAIPEDHFAVVVPSRVGLDKHVRQPAGRVEGHQFVRGVQLQAAGGQGHQLALAPRAVVVCGQEEARHPRGRLVDDGELAEAAGVPDSRDDRELRVHLQPRGAAGEEEVVEAGLGRDSAVDQERVIDQDALGPALDRQQGSRRVAAHQRSLQPEVAHDLQVGGDAAVGAAA